MKYGIEDVRHFESGKLDLFAAVLVSSIRFITKVHHMHNDTELFTIAQALLEQRHTPPVHTVAAALRCQSGEVISAVNIDHFLGFGLRRDSCTGNRY